MPQGDPLYQHLLKWEERMGVCACVCMCVREGHKEEVDGCDSIPVVIYLVVSAFGSFIPHESRVVLHLPKVLSPSGS